MDAVKFVEDKYPETTKEFRRLQQEQYRVFCEKQMDYGPGNISVGTNLETNGDVIIKYPLEERYCSFAKW